MQAQKARFDPVTGQPEVVGRYRVERLIAHGGMGSLYLARDPVIERPVVIKFLKDGFDDPAARERFAREARAAGRLHHPNIVTIFDVGEHENRPFIAMEYVAGETLAQLVARRAVRRLWEKLGIIEALCAGLHYAHSAAIVHRDIKPSNVMRDQSGVVKILDFGIAHGGGGLITQTGDIVGTLNYMSPEQLAGEGVDHRTDIYSVGLLAYELITHQVAFPGTIQTGVLFKILNSAPVSMESLVPGIDPEIPAVITRATARTPDERYPDLESLRQDLAAVRARLLEADDEPEWSGVTDPNAETIILTPRVLGAGQLPSSSRQGSAVASPAGTHGSALQAPSRRFGPKGLLLGAAGAVGLALAGASIFDWFPRWSPQPAGLAQPQSVSPPVPAVSAPPNENAAATPAAPEDQVTEARATARKQIGAGQEEAALETVVRGLAVDGADPELNQLLGEMTASAQRSVREARSAASVRGATSRSSPAFREGQSREREADTRIRAGDQVPGVRAAWAAAALYDRSPEGARQPADPAAPPAAPPGTAALSSGPLPASPSPEALGTLPGRANHRPPAPPPPPVAPKAEPSNPPRDAAPDPRAADAASVRDTLRRYVDAYQSLDIARVASAMPSMTAGQLRDVQREFANYRRYTVQIKEERIRMEGDTATVECEVVRSFEPKSGFGGSHTVQSTFHLRRSGAGWRIERLDSR